MWSVDFHKINASSIKLLEKGSFHRVSTTHLRCWKTRKHRNEKCGDLFLISRSTVSYFQKMMVQLCFARVERRIGMSNKKSMHCRTFNLCKIFYFSKLLGYFSTSLLLRKWPDTTQISSKRSNVNWNTHQSNFGRGKSWVNVENRTRKMYQDYHCTCA